ncbi:MAG: hypothetical protein HXX16_01560 [Bacteroidales bacterium]|nr:hypothetical protein [Bacteroidales bacterium]
MEITRYNYEVFLVDYLDGTLDPSLEGVLIAFLEQNPDLKNQLEGLTDVVLVNDIISYPNKADLKKSSFLKNGIENESEYLYIAFVEGEISDKEKLRLDTILSENHTGSFDLLLYQKTIIQSSSSIVFPDKTRLKRTSIIPIRYSTLKRSIGIAASIGLLLGMYTIGKFLVNTNHSYELKKSDVVASFNHSFINPPKELQKENQYSYAKSQDFVPNKKASKTRIESSKPNVNFNNQTIRKKDPIPAKILSLGSKKVFFERTIQDENIKGLIVLYPRPSNLSEIEKNSYADNSINKPRVREIVFFEILQYGVQSFGKLMGKDIHLNAKKDKNGNIEKVSFESSLIAFSTSIRKKQEDL